MGAPAATLGVQVAFRYAVIETKRVYETDTRLQTEHAQLEDMGTKTGVAEPDGKTGQGLLARRFFLDAGPGRATSNDPQIAALYKDRFALEDQIDIARGEIADGKSLVGLFWLDRLRRSSTPRR
jgi:hypothetical protein